MSDNLHYNDFNFSLSTSFPPHHNTTTTMSDNLHYNDLNFFGSPPDGGSNNWGAPQQSVNYASLMPPTRYPFGLHQHWNDGSLRGSRMQAPAHYLHPQVPSAYPRYAQTSSTNYLQRNSTDRVSSAPFHPRIMYGGIQPVYYPADPSVAAPQELAHQTDLSTHLPSYEEQPGHNSPLVQRTVNVYPDDSPLTNIPPLPTSPSVNNDGRASYASDYSLKPDIPFPCPHKNCGQMVLDRDLSGHYREYHTSEGAVSVVCGTCDRKLQISSRMKHVRGHLGLLLTRCPKGARLFSRPDAARRHASGCDGTCHGMPEVRDCHRPIRPYKRKLEDKNDEDEDGARKRAQKRTRRR